MIKVQNLTKNFNGKTVLNGLNFQVRKGEIFGYLGPNGAGKTTTMRLILGLLKPTSEKAVVSEKISGIGALALIFVSVDAGMKKTKTRAGGMINDT
jgi:ABC-type multidrug transport system ATPase subunit